MAKIFGNKFVKMFKLSVKNVATIPYFIVRNFKKVQNNINTFNVLSV